MKQPIPFGKYFLLERVNVGGMAEVFKAKAIGVEGFERLVAVKRILPSIAEDEEFITMFVDEAKIAVQLTHANIAQIFDLGRVEGSFFIALEYVNGKDLRAIFNRTRQRGELLPIPMSCYAIMKLCEGLDYAHNKCNPDGEFLNLVHRDVSPQNILISYDGEVKIIDFGIAKAAGKAGRTQAGILKGKFGYMSPEQVLGMDIDRRSDVFGVGICLYELLTGERLFVAESDFATLEKVRSVDVMPPSTYNRRIPEELEQIVMRALARDREQRYQTALQLHDELQAFMHTSGNLFSRKDLSAYMHRVFAEEIERESARDLEYAQLGSPSFAPESSGLEVFDEIDPVSTVSALHAQPSQPPPSVMASPVPPPSPSAPPTVARPRKATLLGIPQVAGRPAPKPAPSVPRLIPRLQSVPPSAAARATARSAPQSSPRLEPDSQPSAALARPPSSPPGGIASVPPVSPLDRHASGDAGMEWDDDELSTQIYDKPDDGALGYLFGKQLNSPESMPSAPPAALVPPVSQPPRFQPAAAPRSPSAPPVGASSPAYDAAPRVSPFASAAAAPRAELPLRTTPATLPAVDLPEVGAMKSRASPMLVAILVVLGIIASIVAGLLLFGRPEPGVVQFATVPTKATVLVDGKPVASTTSPFVLPQLAPGVAHTISVSQTGYRSWTSKVELQPGQTLQLPTVRLERIETGFSLDSEPPGAKVLVDGELLAETPARLTKLAPGEHKLRLEREGYTPWESVLHVSAGTVLPLQLVTLQPLVADPSGGRTRSGAGTLPASEASARRRSREAAEAEEREDPPARLASRSSPAPEEPAVRLPEPVVEPPPAPAESAAPPADPAAAGPGTLRVNTRPWSRVFVDGELIGVTPQRSISLPAGKHTLLLVNEEFGLRKSLSIEIKPGEVTTKVLNLLPE